VSTSLKKTSHGFRKIRGSFFLRYPVYYSGMKEDERLLSLDAFRGMTIAAMFLVNNPGDRGHVFAPLRHSEWNGCSAADLIFPFFLFIMGVAMAFSIVRKQELGLPSHTLLKSIVRRSVILIGLGLIITFVAYEGFGGPYRLLGVLQRIGLCYLFASLIMLWTGVRGQALWAAAILIGYYLIVKLVPFPGGFAGSLDPDSNLAAYVDKSVLGFFDPEGILTTIPAIASVLMGVLAGHWLREKRFERSEKAAGLCAAGTVLFIAAALWKYSFPFSKPLWTSSYVLHTTSLALFTLATCYWIMDVRKIRVWAKPCTIYGSNAIAVYFGASVMAYSTIWIHWNIETGGKLFFKTVIYDSLYRSWIPGLFGPYGDYISSVAYGVSYVALWFAVSWILYRRRIFLKV
jgi:predicted acyltransferase